MGINEKVYKARRLLSISGLRTVSMSPSDSQELLDVYNFSGYAEGGLSWKTR